jgi:hypothetical protein
LRGSNLCLVARASSSCSSRSACIRQHTSAYVRHAPAYVSRRQHTSAPRLAPWDPLGHTYIGAWGQTYQGLWRHI